MKTSRNDFLPKLVSGGLIPAVAWQENAQILDPGPKRTRARRNGGGPSCCHPGMYGIYTLVEAVRQLRGQAGECQIGGAEIAVAHGNGGVLSSQVTALLRTSSTV